MTYEEYIQERMKALQTYDYVAIYPGVHIIKMYSRDKEEILDAMEKSMFSKEDSGEFLIRNEDSDNFNLRMFAVPDTGLSSIEICCPSEVSQVIKMQIDDLLKKTPDMSLGSIFDNAIEDFINCEIEMKIKYDVP